MTRMTVSFTLDTQEDRRTVRYLEGLPKGEKSKAIRAALDAYLGGAGVTLADVYKAVKDLERKVGSGFVLVQTGNLDTRSQALGEPADVAANLDNLGV